MTFMRKILDALNMKKSGSQIKETEEIENGDENISEVQLPKEKIKSKSKYMSKYDIERYAIECNAYIVREERKERQEQEQRELEQKDNN